MTKHLDQKSLDMMLSKLSVVVTEGRAASAPKLSKESAKSEVKAQSVDLWAEAVKSVKSRGSWADAGDDEGWLDVNSFEPEESAEDSAQIDGLRESEFINSPWAMQSMDDVHQEKGNDFEDAGTGSSQKETSRRRIGKSAGEVDSKKSRQCQKHHLEQKKKYWAEQRGGVELCKKVEVLLMSRIMADDDNNDGDNIGDDDDDDDDDVDKQRMPGQLVITHVIFEKGKNKEKGKSERYAARESGHQRIDDYEMLTEYLSGDEVAQLGSFARAARGEVQNMPPSRYPNTLDVHECRLTFIFMHTILYRSTYRRMHTSLCGSSELS